MTDVRPPTQSYIGKRRSQPSFGIGEFIQLAARAGDGDELLARRQAQRLEARLRLEHAVASFLRAAGLGGRRGPASVSDRSPRRASRRSMPSGSVLSRKCGVSLSVGGAEGVRDELRPERGAADADDQHVGERLASPAAFFTAPDARRRRSP